MQIFVLFAAASAFTQSPTQDIPTAASEYVSYTDLDLGTDIGRRRLEHRLVAAASRLCTMDPSGLPASYVDYKCYRASMKIAREQMDRVITRAMPRAAYGLLQ